MHFFRIWYKINGIEDNLPYFSSVFSLLVKRPSRRPLSCPLEATQSFLSSGFLGLKRRRSQKTRGLTHSLCSEAKKRRAKF